MTYGRDPSKAQLLNLEECLAKDATVHYSGLFWREKKKKIEHKQPGFPFRDPTANSFTPFKSFFKCHLHSESYPTTLFKVQPASASLEALLKLKALLPGPPFSFVTELFSPSNMRYDTA